MTTPTSNDRLGLPSGSSALYDSLCHGRFQLQQAWETACPEIPPEEEEEDYGGDMDKDREAGNRIHLLYAGKECLGATQAEVDRAEKALRVDATMQEQWKAQWELEPLGSIVEMREQRWWLYDENGLPIYSGQSDAVWIRGEKDGPADILLGDLKGLWGHHDQASINMQIRRYVALIAENIQGLGYSCLRSAMAYLNQPAKTVNPQPAVFDEDAIQMAVIEMRCDLALITAPNPSRTAGAVQCHHCRAKLICPEFQETEAKIMNVIAPVQGSVAVPPEKKEIEESLRLLPSDQLARLLGWVPALRDAADLAQFEAKRRLRIDENSVPGWRLWPNTPREKVKDITTVYNRMSKEYGVQGQEFTALCTITKSNLTDLIRAKAFLRGKALEAKLKEILDGATEKIKVSASLERVK